MADSPGRWRRECPTRRLPAMSDYVRQAFALRAYFRFQRLDCSDVVRLNPALICTLIRTWQRSGAALRKTNKLTTLSVKRMSKPGLYGDGDGLSAGCRRGHQGLDPSLYACGSSPENGSWPLSNPKSC